MNLYYKSYSIEYEYIYKKSNDTIVFLHGWGGNKNSFNFLHCYLQNYNVLAISFPPYFTKTDYIDSSVSLCMQDYLEILTTILKLHNIASAHIVCHSFGFRICLMLFATSFEIKSVVVTGGAGINLYKNIFNNLKLYNKIIWNKKLNIVDKNLDINMLKNTDKKTFKNIVNQDLTLYSKLIKKSMLIFWGKYDTATPIKIANILNKHNKNSKKVIVKSDHFAYLNFHNLFTKEVLNFLKEKV